jgi:hypothetical protein
LYTYTIRDVKDNDTSIDKDFGAKTSKVQKILGAFRFLRIVQHGPSKAANLPDWVNVLVLTGFEVYGSLYTSIISPYNETTLSTGSLGVIAKTRKVTVKASGVGRGAVEDFVSEL